MVSLDLAELEQQRQGCAGWSFTGERQVFLHWRLALRGGFRQGLAIAQPLPAWGFC